MRETHSIEFAPFRLNLEAEQLWRGTEVRVLTHKAFATLRYLVAHAGQLVTKEALIAAVWEVPHVSDAALAVCIRELRRALDDSAQRPQFLETVRGRGYRFVAPVTAVAPARSGSGRAPAPPGPAPRPGLVVGREAELRVLQQGWAQAQQGLLQGEVFGKVGD